MTLETILLIVVVAWAIGLFTLKDIVEGIKELKSVRRELTENSGTKKKTEWTDERIREVLGKMDLDDLKAKADSYTGKWKTFALEEISKKENNSSQGDDNETIN